MPGRHAAGTWRGSGGARVSDQLVADLEQATEFLDFLYRDLEGVAYLAVLHDGDWNEVPYQWSEQRSALLEVAMESASWANVYVSCLLFEGSKRSIETALPGKTLWVDVDHGLTAEQAELIQSEPAFRVVKSGTPGHSHVYLELAESMSPDELRRGNRWLVDRLDGDSGWQVQSMRRLPGTFNYRSDPPLPVVLTAGGGPPVASGRLWDLVGDWTPPEGARGQGKQTEIVPVAVPVSPAMQRKLDEDPRMDDTSAHAYEVVQFALETGHSDGGIAWMAPQCRAYQAWAAKNHSRSIARDVARQLATSRPNHAHPGQPCDKAGCPNTPKWQKDKSMTNQRRVGDGSDLALAPDGFRLTDVGNSERFIKLMDGKVRYAHIWSCWLVYRKGRWIRDPKGELVTEMAKRVAKSLLALVAKMPVPDRDDQKSERDRVYKAAIRLESKASIFAMVQLARAIPGVIVDHEELDANPDILNCLNGTVDLRTGDLRPHDPADLCTQQCPVNYDPNAQAPLWEACLLRWQPDPEIREYLQREAGAGACGRQTETLSIHYGHGANGKSKYWGAIGKVLGPYAMVPHKSLIVASRHEQHPTVVASLFRARLAIASETEKSANINEEQVKNLTGNDRISARKMYQDEWSFDPSHTLVLFSNFLPTIQGTDNGIWRRVRMIPWDVTIPVDERDEELADKLTTEAAGILRWMVEGAVRFLEVGIGAPASIQASTAEFRGEQDTVTRFITEAGLVFDPNGSVRSADLQVVHEEWCDEAGEDARGHYKRVAHELTRRGAKAERRKTGRYWAGVALVDQQSKGVCVSDSQYPMELPDRGVR